MSYTNIASLKKMFGPKLEQSKNLVIAPPKMDIINLVTSFVYLKLKVIETWCEKNQAKCMWYKWCTWKCWEQSWEDWELAKKITHWRHVH